MKKSKYVKIAVTAVIAAAILYIIMSIIDNIGVVYESLTAAFAFVLRIVTPVLFGVLISFLLSRPVSFFTRLLRKAKFFDKRFISARAVGSLASMILLFSLIALFFYALIPSLIQSVQNLTMDLPGVVRVINSVLVDLSKNPEISSIFDFMGINPAATTSVGSIITEFWGEIVVFLQQFTNWVFGFIVNTGVLIYNLVLGVIVSIYMLIYKNQIIGQISKLTKSLSQESHYRVAFVIKVADQMFYKYLIGRGLCSLGIGLITFAVCSFLGFKYSLLIGLIIAVTNMVPTFGPLIGAIPATLFAMMTAPIYGVYMLIIVVALQILDGNIIGPKVLGDSMGINVFWIVFSIIIMGGLFGIGGMIIAAPLCGLLRILIKNWLFRRQNTNEKLKGEAEYAASLQRYRQWITRKSKSEPL